MSCCGAAKWKREHIEDHKFDLIDVDDFIDNSCWTQILYSWVFVVTLKSVLVYMADLGVVLLLITQAIDKGSPNKVSGTSFSTDANSTTTNGDNNFGITNEVRFWLIMATVLLSYILLAVEWRKALNIIKSKDISYAFTNEVAFRYYAIRSYPHFCLFQAIEGSRKPIDRTAFWVFFTFRNWKRLLLAEFPRQFLNFILLYDAYKSTMETPPVPSDGSKIYSPFCQTNFGLPVPNTTDPFNRCAVKDEVSFPVAMKYLMVDQGEPLNMATLYLSSLTVMIWAWSAFQLASAFLVYIPLLFNIRGNLKEYCCHKVDKRIAEILRKKSRKRAEQARKREMKEMAKYGKSGGSGRPTPTLPDVSMDVMSQPAEQYAYYDDASTVYESTYARSTTPLYGAGYYAPSSGPGSAYGGSNSGYPPGPPLPNPYVRALAQGGPGPQRPISPVVPVTYDYEVQSDFGGSQGGYHRQGPAQQQRYQGAPGSDYGDYVAQYSDQGSNFGDHGRRDDGGHYGGR